MPSVNDAVRRNAFLATVIGWWRQRRLDGRPGALGEDDEVELMRLAAETGLSRDDIEILAAQGEFAGGLMQRMLASHHISALDLATTRPQLYDRMALHCAECREKDRCRHELDAGTAAAHAPDFCPNADMIRNLAVQGLNS